MQAMTPSSPKGGAGSEIAPHGLELRLDEEQAINFNGISPAGLRS
jgi:hypothetical protein